MLPNLLGFESLYPIEMEEDDEGRVVITVENLSEAKTPCCLFQDLNKNGRKAITVKDFPLRRKPVLLRILRQRFYCKSCGDPVYDDLPDVDSVRDITNRFREQLEKDGTAFTFIDAARINGVDESLVRRVFKDYAAEALKDYTFKLPRVLGMDEKVIQGHPRFVIGDVEAKRMLDMQKSRQKLDLISYFEPLEGREDVEVITQDMWKGYRDLNKKFFRNADVVVDKFHVVRYANLAVEAVRKSLYSGLPNDERKSLKRRNRLLGSRPKNLTEKGQEALERTFHDFPILALAFDAKERFYAIYDLMDRRQAEDAYNEWRATLHPDLHEPFKALIGFMGTWRAQIMRYFQHRYTNAYIERLNGLIGEINLRGKGYDLDTLRAKALLKHGNVVRLGDMVDFDLMSLGQDWERIVSTAVGHGIDLSAFEADLRGGTF